MVLSIAVASKGQNQDTGAKMIHVAPHTSSTVVSKSISQGGGNTTYRGLVHFAPTAGESKAHVRCDTLIMDDDSASDTIPYSEVSHANVEMEHEATVTKVSEEALFYLMCRGLSEEDATRTVVMGFVEPFTRELPMEFAVEMNRLIKFEMEGAIGERGFPPAYGVIRSVLGGREVFMELVATQEDLERSILLITVDKMVHWVQKSSIWPATLWAGLLRD